jgi:hypothetical protein
MERQITESTAMQIVLANKDLLIGLLPSVRRAVVIDVLHNTTKSRFPLFCLHRRRLSGGLHKHLLSEKKREPHLESRITAADNPFSLREETMPKFSTLSSWQYYNTLLLLKSQWA